MLLILQCLLSTNGHLVPGQFAFRLNEWTDIGFPELGNKACCGVGFTVGSVIGHPEFLTDPHKAAFDIWKSKGCDLAANGAVMRTAVLGIPLFFDEPQVVLNAINSAKVTHADPRCIFSSVVVSVLISRLIRKSLGVAEYEIDDADKEKFLKLSGNQTTVDDNHDQKQVLSADLCIAKKVATQENKSPNFFQSMWSKLSKGGQKSDDKWPPWFPKHKDTDPARLQTPAKCSNDPNRFSTASCDQDESLMADIEKVVSDYKFLIKSSNDTKQQNWLADVDKFCFPKNLHEMALDEKSSIGYTLKCLGSALFCFSRRQSNDMKKGDFFMQIITELTLEAGDADTNAAVAGALLGGRLGFKGLPRVWLDGLRNREFLFTVCGELLELVVEQLESSGL